MIGPSSSHTAGVVKIGKVARILLGEEVKSAIVYFSGSFIYTYKGHGSDKAVAGGLLGFNTKDTRIRRSLSRFEKQDKEIEFKTKDLSEYHPNTLEINAIGINGKKVNIIGCSIGGGSILIRKIDNYEIEFDGKNNTLIVPHTDVKGVVAEVTALLVKHKINIANMRVFRSERGGKSMMIIEADERIRKAAGNEIELLPYVDKITYLEPLK